MKAKVKPLYLGMNIQTNGIRTQAKRDALDTYDRWVARDDAAEDVLDA